jgi:hypothetical protein
VEAAFDGGTVTSDGGALLLREVEQARGILGRFGHCFEDLRDPDRIEHTVPELLSQRVFGLCLGYEDLNDHDVLRRDPLLALLCGKADPSPSFFRWAECSEKSKAGETLAALAKTWRVPMHLTGSA